MKAVSIIHLGFSNNILFYYVCEHKFEINFEKIILQIRISENMTHFIKTVSIIHLQVDFSYNYLLYAVCKRGTKDTKGTVKLVNLKQTDNAMDKNEKDKQTTAHMTQHKYDLDI